MEQISKFRLKVYQPWAATPHRIVTDIASLELVLNLNDHSNLRVTIQPGSPQETWLHGPIEVALEVWDGKTWTEPYGCRFLPTVGESNRARAGDAETVAFLGISQALRWASIKDPTPGNEEGKRVFEAQPPGQILDTIMRDARKRGTSLKWAPSLAWVFNAQRDSAGQGWGKNARVSFPPSASVEKVLEWLVSKGAVDWRMNGRELQVYRADGALAPRRDTVAFRDAFAASLPVKVSYERLASTAYFRGENGTMWEKHNPGGTPFGRIERWSEHGQVKLEPTAQLYLDELLKAGEAPLVQHRREWELTADYRGPVLWVGYQVGDWVPVNGEYLRVVEAGLSMDESGKITGWDTLGTRIQDFLERLARKTTDLSDGMVGGENSPVSVDLGPDQETGTPAAPTGLVVSSDPVTGDEGGTRSVVQMAWSKVTATVEGRPVTVPSYVVETTVNGRTVEQREVLTHTAAFMGFPGERWRIRVRARSKQNVLGEWSTVVDHVLAADKVPPPKPATPTLSNDLGVLRVSHSGLAAGGGPMPPDVARWEVAVSTSVAMPAAPDATVADAGGMTWHRAGLTAGTRYYVRVRAVDRSENIGPWSDYATGTVTKVFDDSTLRREIANGTIINDDAIKTRHIAALAVGADEIAANAIRAGHMQVGALDGYILTGATVQTVHEARRGVKMNRDGIVAYDYTGAETVRISADGGVIRGYTITGSVLVSESGGSRVEITNGEVTIKRNGHRQMVFDDDGMTIWEGNRQIGRIATNSKREDPNVKGLSMALENSGDYISWSYQKAPTDMSYTAMMVLDPKGRFRTGRPGLNIDTDIWIDGKFRIPGTAPLTLGSTGFDGISGEYPAWKGEGGAKVAFVGRDLYIVSGGFYFNFTRVIERIEALERR